MAGPVGFDSFNPWYAALRQGGAAPAGPVTLLFDSFTEASATSIVSHTPDTVVAPAATPWAQNATHFRVDDSGVLELVTTPSANRQCYINGGIANGIVSVSSMALSGLMFRHANTTNYWLAYNVGATIDLYEITAGTLSVRAQWSTGGTANRKIQVITNGTSISVYVDGTLRISHASSSHQTATGVGFRSEGSSGSIGAFVADNLTVIDSTDAGNLP